MPKVTSINSPDSFSKSIAIIGLGYIGLPTAATLASTGLNVKGVDLNKTVVTAINKGKTPISEKGLDILVKNAVANGNLKATTSLEHADVYIIAVPTPICDDKSPDLSYVESATKAICTVLRRGDLIIVESTVPPATCVNVVAPLIELELGFRHGHDYLLAHCPERVIPGNILSEMIHNDRIVGGTTPEATLATAELYERFVQGNIFKTNATTAELCKLMENSYRDVNIALANELADLADTLDIDITEAIRLSNRHPRVNLHSPSIGVGGHCIPVDPWFIIDIDPTKAQLLRTARHINDARPQQFAERILSYLETVSKRETIVLLGLSYKANVDDMRESPAIELVERLAKETKHKLWLVEPHLSQLPAELAVHDNLELVSIETAFRTAQQFIVLVEHSIFQGASETYQKPLRQVLSLPVVHGEAKQLSLSMPHLDIKTVQHDALD